MYTNYVDSIAHVRQFDPEVADAMQKEFDRQSRNIELIASENIVSPAVLSATGSVLTNKYAEGYPAKRYYGGCECVDIVENIARDRAKAIFGAEHANVQPHSGSQANAGAYFALLQPGDVILGMSLDNGGHLTHGSPVNFSGKTYKFIPYGVDDNGFIDYDKVRELALEHKPKMIVAGASAYPRIIDFEKFSAIAKEVGSLFMVDMAHIAGLVAAGVHPSPIPYADIVTTTTHKTLRGPRGGMILCKAEYAQKVDKAIFPGLQGGPLEHVIAAKAVSFGEVAEPGFKEYQKRVVANCKRLSEELNKLGVKMVSGGTDNHLILLDLRETGVTGKELEHRLDAVYITVNKNTVPNEPLSPFVTSGVRIGTAAVTTRGFGEEEMVHIAKWLHQTITDYEATAESVRAGVTELCAKFPIYVK